MTLDAPFRPKNRLWTTTEYHRMVESGLLNEKSKVELLNGQIIEMSPIGTFHASCVKCISKLIRLLVGDQGIIGVQDPVMLNEYNEPEPDISILKYKKNFYADAHPGPDDILLVIEVADSSLSFDQEFKFPIYAEAGVNECWLVNIKEKQVERFSSPSTVGYQQREVYTQKDSIALLEYGAIRVKEMFPF